MANLTDTLIKKLPVPTVKKTLTRDGQVSRFMAQVTRDGCRSFVIRYSVNRRERLYTIGRFPDWPTAAAREEAKRLLQLVDRGIDPLAQRITTRDAPTVCDLAKRYLEEYAPTKRASYVRNNAQIISRWILPELGALKVADVRASDIGELHRKVTKVAPIMANRCLSTLSRMFALAVRWEWRTDNPCAGAVDRNVEINRRVYLKPAQLVDVSAALQQLRDQKAADCIRLIMLTGCRRGEALAARVDQIDLQGKVWRLPASSVKQNRPHEVPLSAPAVALLARVIARAKGAYLFPGRDGTGHLHDLRKSWAAVCKAAGLDDVRLHDLRHSFASIAVSRGASLPLIGALLGHSNPKTTQRYAHLHDDPQRAVAESVAAVIMGGDGGNVVPYERGARR